MRRKAIGLPVISIALALVLCASTLGRSVETYEGSIRFHPENEIRLRVAPPEDESDRGRVAIRIRSIPVFCDDGTNALVTPDGVVHAKISGTRFAKTRWRGSQGTETLVEVRGHIQESRIEGTVLYIRRFSGSTPDCSTQGRWRWRAHPTL